jgi:hypothetical protein
VYYGKNGFQKSLLEQVFTLILLALIAGIIGGGMVGLATDHRVAASASSGTGLTAQ